MQNWFLECKYNLLILRKSLSFSKKLVRRAYKRYIGHDKIIAWHKGYPMFTTFTPAPMSDVFTNNMATFVVSNFKFRPGPHLVDIAVTDKCNSNCVHCSFFINKSKNTAFKKDEVLSKDELKKIIDDCLDLGVSSFNFVGGEPLLREDILDIITYIDKDLAICSIFTNGWFLEDYAKKLKKAGLTSVKVSIDSADPNVHDKLRNHPGLFDKAIKGIKEAKKQGIITAISCCITKKDLEDGSLIKIIELGKKLDVNEIIIFDALPTGKYSHRDDLFTDKIKTEDLMKVIEPYNKNLDYPGIFAYSYVRSHKSMGCAGGVSYFYVSPYGNISPCDFNHMVVGNIRKEPLFMLWDKLSSKAISYSCNSCGIFNQDKK